jgi:hypothetical protein
LQYRGSLPKKLNAGEANTYEFGLKIPALEGQEDATNARAIVLLINKDTKEIVNADIVAINATTVGIGLVENNNATQDNAAVYNLNGQRINQPARGMYIMGGKKYIVR